MANKQNILKVIGWILAAFIALDLLYWAALGIFFSIKEPERLGESVFGSIHIGVFVTLVYTIDRLFESSEDWWDVGIPSWGEVAVLMLIFFFLGLAETFVLLEYILAPKLKNDPYEKEILSLGIIQMAFTLLAMAWVFAVAYAMYRYREKGKKIPLIFPEKHGKKTQTQHMMKKKKKKKKITKKQLAQSLYY